MSNTTLTDYSSQLPSSVKERLQGLRSAAHPSGVFTSDLSVNEFLLVRKAGFEPIGLCVGSCIYHVGIQYSSWNQNQEMTVLSQAMYHARELAMSRMREEARGMGADGIVGVRLEIKHVEWDANLLEFVAIGTGVVHNHDTKGFKAHDGGPFTSDLSGQDFYTLLGAGYRPVEMVMGSCVYHVAHRGMLQAFRQAGRNVELEQFTQALYSARELAIERMQKEAQDAKAEGVVGTLVQEKSYRWESHVIEFFAIGTAVVPLNEEIAPKDIPAPTLVLSVND
ncbi:heavy metal-binding domain-containing protein [Paraburkholderia sp. ZP32-5]|uniref:heavy metal-binding domain-containing protein n=1 Tax=Paraburkholderia sp. ZP32-5 TaxID=2883245 RepID=UPI001F3A78AC|nr:heavy metal-binding domain-containing protein [Paraburkholderia sp. ZP32-5]